MLACLKKDNLLADFENKCIYNILKFLIYCKTYHHTWSELDATRNHMETRNTGSLETQHDTKDQALSMYMKKLKTRPLQKTKPKTRPKRKKIISVFVQRLF